MVRSNNRNNINITEEYRNFSLHSDQWWNESGSFEILHRINPVRIKYIYNNIKNYKKIKVEKKYPLKHIKIIDLGCGGGLVCEPLARLGAEVSGYDFVEKNIIEAKKHAVEENLNIEYNVGNINDLYTSKKYDVVLMLEIIEHLNNWKNSIKKIDQLLKDKGIVIFSSINRNLLSKFAAIFLAEKVLKWIPRGTHQYNKLVRPNELVKILKINNYKVLDTSGMIYNPITRNWRISKTKTKINYFCTAQKIS